MTRVRLVVDAKGVADAERALSESVDCRANRDHVILLDRVDRAPPRPGGVVLIMYTAQWKDGLNLVTWLKLLANKAPFKHAKSLEDPAKTSGTQT